MIDKRLIEIFLEVAKIEGISGKEKSVAEYIKNSLRKLSLTFTTDNSADHSKSDTGNIICKFGDGGNRVLLSHMDTARTTYGLKPVLKEDRITSDGRTVLGVDNRVGVAVLLYLAEKVINNNISINDFTIAFTTCEETSLEGSKNLDLNGRMKLGFVFDSYLRPGKFISISYGASSFRVIIIGKASHSGIAPEQGINALKIAVNALSRIKLGRINPSTTVNVGIIRGGTAVNVVPGEVTLEGEVRSIDIPMAEKCLEEIRKIILESANEMGGKIKFESRWDFKPYTLKIKSRVYQNIFKAISKVGLKPEPSISWGGSDANSLNDKGIQAVNIGIGAQNPHSNEEFILYEDLQKSFEIALELVKK